MPTLRALALTFAAFMIAQGSAHATLIWDGSATRGTGVFKLIGSNCASPGSVSAVNDTTYGTVWRYAKPSGLDRCESHGISVNGNAYTFSNGSTYYLGWRYKLSNNVNNNAQFQWKVYPSPGPAGLNWPLALKMIGGNAVMLNRKATDEVYEIWQSPQPSNTWTHMVLAIRLSSTRDGGYVEIWKNGVQQTLLGGTTRWACRLYDVEHVCPKWGVYGASGATVNNYVHALKIGTTFADVGPGGVVTPTPTPTPTGVPPTPTPTPTPTLPPVGDVEITPGGSSVTASTNDGNLPANTVDDSLATRWSANGDGQWIQYDLGATRTVGSVRAAWYQGNTRRARFDLQVSGGASGPWTTLLGGAMSGGTTTALETYDVADTGGRYVRIVGHGNTVNLWNSITEVQVWGR